MLALQKPRDRRGVVVVWGPARFERPDAWLLLGRHETQEVSTNSGGCA